MGGTRRGGRFQRTLASSLPALEAACCDLRAYLQARDVGDASFCAELVARELLNNAVLHGNALDTAKTVELELAVGWRWITIRVTDEGAGFDWRAACRRPLEDTSATHGRGLAICRTYGRHLTYRLGGRQALVRLLRHAVPTEERNDGSGLHD